MISLKQDYVYVNSADKISGTADNFTYNFADQLTGGTNNNYDRMSLLQFNAPKTYYLFDEYNNTFTLTENSSTATVTIDPGSYNVTTLLTELERALNDASPLNYTYTVIFTQSVSKYEFTVSDNSGIQPIFTFSADSCYQIVGFDIAAYQFSGNKLEAVNCCNLQRTGFLLLNCDQVEKSILAVIPSNNVYFGSINYQNTAVNINNVKIVGININNARFYLTDDKKRHISLNGQDVSFQFIIYKSNNYYNVVLEKMRNEWLAEEFKNRFSEEN